MTVHREIGGVRAFSLCHFVKVLLIMCRTKYNKKDLKEFKYHIREILQHDTCRAEFLEYFLERRKVVTNVRVWELANAIINTVSEEKIAKFRKLIQMVDDIPDYTNVLRNLDENIEDEESINNTCKMITKKTCDVLENEHKEFTDYLEDKYGPTQNGPVEADVDTSKLTCQKCGRFCRSRIGLFSHFRKCQRT